MTVGGASGSAYEGGGAVSDNATFFFAQIQEVGDMKKGGPKFKGEAFLKRNDRSRVRREE